MASDRSDDELLRRAQALQQQLNSDHEDASKDHDSAAERALRESPLFGRISRICRKLARWLGPLGWLLTRIVRLLGKWFIWVAFQPEYDSGSGKVSGRHFSLVRLLRCLPLTAAALFGLHVLWSAIYFYGTAFTETVYVTGKQEIETGELYQFGGCTSLPCSTVTDNGKFYLIESSLYFPTMFYPEENVFANIPQQDAACNVRGYGIYFRTLRWLYKSAQLYQHVTDVSCRPYTDEETRRAVSYGEIVKDE
jgi:hypothetical protein